MRKMPIFSLIALLALFLGIAPQLAQANTLSLSQSSVSVGVGQNVTVSAYSPYSQTLNVTAISNTGVAYANVSGSTITVYGLASGSSTVTVCTYDNYCANLYVTVGSGGYYDGGQISFSRNNVSMYPGENTSVAVYSASSSNPYISNNSNSGVVNAYVSGSTVYLNAYTSGSSTITVCSNYGQCGTLYVTVSGGGTTGQVSLSPSSLSLSVNETRNVSVAVPYLSQAYISNNSNSSVATASIYGSTLEVRGQSAGNATIKVCAGSEYSCAYLYVTVIGYSGGGISFSQSSVNLNQGQSTTISIYGGSGYYGSSNYYVSNNSNSSAITASISGSSLYLYGQNQGSSAITVCHNYGQCGTVYAYVSGYGSGYGNLYFTTTTLPQAYANQYYSTQLNVSGASYPVTYTVSSGQLPWGLYLSANGLLSGTPTSGAGQSFTVRATDASGRTAYQNFSLFTGGSVLGSLAFNNGTLINDNGTIYITYKNTKSGFANMSAFNQLGYKTSNLVASSTSSLSNTGYVITHGNVAHPWGSWVKSGQTVYFVHEAGLIPVPSYSTFVNNGGRDSLVVEMNSYDYGKQMLSLMTDYDPRLR